jgi:alkanesulfonate monooxygenase SsuD/methylene tetrahydromethanopterin reductase-like flavin-dependent oxidoreductase (luciferase family)
VDEAVAVCQRLWTEDVIEHHGEFFDFEPVMFVPKPTQTPWPPLHFGGDGPAAFRRAATIGDGWIPLNHTAQAIPAAVAELARRREEAGRTGTVEITLAATSAGLDGMRRFADRILPSLQASSASPA